MEGLAHVASLSFDPDTLRLSLWCWINASDRFSCSAWLLRVSKHYSVAPQGVLTTDECIHAVSVCVCVLGETLWELRCVSAWSQKGSNGLEGSSWVSDPLSSMTSSADTVMSSFLLPGFICLLSLALSSSIYFIRSSVASFICLLSHVGRWDSDSSQVWLRYASREGYDLCVLPVCL